MKTYKKVDSCLNAIYKKPNGKEKQVNESLFFGVGLKKYAYLKDVKAAKIKDFRKGKNALFVYLTKLNVKKLLEYLLNKDGILYIS